MRRFGSLLVAILILSTVAIQPAAALQATPTAVAPDRPEIGTAVTVTGTDGSELAQVKVSQILDPFDAYEPNAPPKRGFRFVLLHVSVVNSGTRALGIDPASFGLVDSDGFRYTRFNVNLGKEPVVPRLDRQNAVAPGAAVTGAVGFEVLEGVRIVHVVYAPGNDRLITVVDRRGPLPVLGAAVPFVGTEGSEIGQITITSLADPFVDYDPNAPPRRGNRFVLIDVTIANTGSRPLDADPSDLLLLDSDGFLYGRAGIRRDQTAIPDLKRQRELAPGEEAVGAIGFDPPSGVTLVAVIYVPENGRLIVAGTIGG
jgi:hypothetical protein